MSMLCLQEGTSNYFKGLMLILCYVIVAASFFVHEDPPSEGQLLCSIVAVFQSNNNNLWLYGYTQAMLFATYVSI